MQTLGFGHGRAALITVLCVMLVLMATNGTIRAAITSYRSEVAVEAEVEPFVVTRVLNPLRFEIKGAVGEYDSVNAAEYTLEANVPVTVKLDASPLSYENDSSIALDVVYWVNEKNRNNSFTPGEPKSITLPFAHFDRHTLQLRGRVIIHGVADQPAGSYAGTIWITVSAQQ